MLREHSPSWICVGELGIVLIYFEFLYMDTCVNTSFCNSMDVKYLVFYQLQIWCSSGFQCRCSSGSMMMCLPFILSSSTFGGDLSKYKNLAPIGKQQEDLNNLESVQIVCYVVVFIRNSYLSSFVWEVSMALHMPKSNSMTVISLFLYSFLPSCIL